MISKRVSDLVTMIILLKLHAITMLLLKKRGFNENIKYSPSHLKQRNSKRQIIWFNPPYSVIVKTNVGKLFTRLIVIVACPV